MSGWWDRHVVPRLIGYGCGQPAVMARRALVVPQARGEVLEVGCGGGANFPLYDAARVSRVMGVDPSAELRARAMAAIPGGVSIAVQEGFAEKLPFADRTFDTAVLTFTLCSVRDPGAVLAELRRTLRPDGKLLFLEHGRSPDAGVEAWQHRIEPVWKRLMGGCHLARPVEASIAAAGFRIIGGGRGYLEDAPRFAGWMEWGEAAPG